MQAWEGEHLVQCDVNLHTWLAAPNLLSVVLNADDSAPYHQLLVRRCGFLVSHLRAMSETLYQCQFPLRSSEVMQHLVK